MAFKTDTVIIRELAKRYKELAQNPVCAEREKRARQTNVLVPARPIVWMDELPWHELNFNGSLILQCEEAFAREMESFFRRTLFRWEHFQADMIVENYYSIYKDFTVTGLGIDVDEQTIATDSDNHIISHHYEDILDSEEKLEALQAPVVTAQPETDARRMEEARELLGGLLDVKLRGHQIYHSPWDDISRYRGVEPILIDAIERPALLHKTIDVFTENYISRWKQMEALGLLDSNILSLHCTPGFCDELSTGGENTPEGEDCPAKLKNVWFRGMAQIFGAVSPAMHDEFDLQYMKRAMELCGPVYYGCCEPLDKKIDLLKKIPNMRKIGVSPWANVASCAEQIAGDYVLSRKPNPAFVAGTIDEETVRAEAIETAEACLKFGCPCDIVLKDVSTVSYKVKNLIDWNRIVQETLDKYYPL